MGRWDLAGTCYTSLQDGDKRPAENEPSYGQEGHVFMILIGPVLCGRMS